MCSIREYQRSENGRISAAGTIRATCPNRFEEGGLIYQWIGEILLNSSKAIPIGQVNFLERVPLARVAHESANLDIEGREGVGRIDNVMIVPDTAPLQWCPVEIQAVYFSGDAMAKDFAAIRRHRTDEIPFPAGKRRPDYRSSAPKRLMPQLQIKVPTLRRWGKKMGVVVDEDFFNAMGRINTVPDLSNCDVAWFVVRFDDRCRLTRENVLFATLEESVQGLIAGKPVSQSVFEGRIQRKLAHLRSEPGQVSPNE